MDAKSRPRLQRSLIVLLVEHPDEVVTREELRSRLWPADAFVDFDHGLNAAIKRLRDALGESAETPRFVETLTRRGYRFIDNVEIPAAAPPQFDLALTRVLGCHKVKPR